MADKLGTLRIPINKLKRAVKKATVVQTFKNVNRKFLNISEDSWSTFFDMPDKPGPTSCGCRKSCACCTCCQKKATTRCKPFISLNVIAALGHFINFLIAVFSSTSNGQENNTQLRHLYSQWGIKQKYCNKTCPNKFYTVTATLDGINETYKNPDGTTDFVVNPFATKEANTLNLFTLVIAFHLLSFVFQMFVAINYKKCSDRYCGASCSDRCCQINYVSNVLNRGVNSWRFIEYSISATIMLVSICIISGILDFTAILCVGLFTFVTQLLGLVSEILFQDGTSYDDFSKFKSTRNLEDRIGKNISDRRIGKDAKNQMRCMGWAVHFIGWITMLTAYLGILITHFYISNGSSENSAPDFVQVAIWSVFIFYNLFGVTQVCQLLLKDNCCSEKCSIKNCCNKNCCSIPRYYFFKTEGYDGARAGISGTNKCPCIPIISINEWVELFYVILSLSSKTVLGSLILINALRDNVTFRNRESC